MADAVRMERPVEENRPARVEQPRRGLFARRPWLKWALLALLIVVAVGGYFAWSY